MLVDTSGLLALLSSRELAHERAKELFTGANRLLAHNYIVAELLALAAVRGIPRTQVLEFVTRLPTYPGLEFAWVDRVIHDRALALLSNRLDKSYSLCDAVSFVLMRDRNLVEALTSDHHFVQEGFVKLLD